MGDVETILEVTLAEEDDAALRRLRISKELLGRLAIDENPRTALPGIIALLVETVRHQPETIRLLYVSLFELDHGSERVLRKHLSILFEPVRSFPIAVDYQLIVLNGNLQTVLCNTRNDDA